MKNMRCAAILFPLILLAPVGALSAAEPAANPIRHSLFIAEWKESR